MAGWSVIAIEVASEEGPRVPVLVIGSEAVLEVRANAHLVAAAPELLAALERIYAYSFAGAEDGYDSIREQARAALAKARALSVEGGDQLGPALDSGEGILSQ